MSVLSQNGELAQDATPANPAQDKQGYKMDGLLDVIVWINSRGESTGGPPSQIGENNING